MNPMISSRLRSHFSRRRVLQGAAGAAALAASGGIGAASQELANTLGVTQANISRIEHEEDLYLSTLRGYVEALGGRLEVNAVFPDETVTLIAAKP